MSTLTKQYDSKTIEQKWHQFYAINQYYGTCGTGDDYTILLPPPNVTGSLHMGHGFQHAIMDCLIRYHKMQGFKVLWQPGFDHAGIATQMVVSRQLEQQGQNISTMARQALLDAAMSWTNSTKNNIQKQIEQLGSSLDWSIARFTLDQGSNHAVNTAFIKLYEDGLIYSGYKLVNWDPKLQTAISDIEVIKKEINSKIYTVNYELADANNKHISVQTTRPETIFADVAIAFHPEDKRYQHLIGKHAITPITNNKIPFIADEFVDPSFGTGLVKITPGHDFNDFAVGERHQLKQINLLHPDGTLNANVPKEFQGLDIKEARKLILSKLSAINALGSINDHKSIISIGDRSGATIEPFLTKQWFVKTKQLAKEAIEVVKSGQIKFYPSSWVNTYYHWLENIEDWCISRQLWWGHQIPVWYDTKGNAYAGLNKEAVMQKYNLAKEELTQETDVLDTWFSSALWPLTTSNWPENVTSRMTSDVLVTGFDIIFFWVARMIMFSLYFTKTIPFKKVLITGLVKDEHGEKMSKSKGNIIDPIDLIHGISLPDLLDKRTKNLMQPSLIEKITKNTTKEFADGIKRHGVDAVRMNFCALAHMGTRDINFDMQRLNGFSNFANKLYQGARFVLDNCNDKSYESNLKAQTELDKIILSRLSIASAKCYEHISNFRFDLLVETLYTLVWDDFCAFYIEACKFQLQDKNAHSTKAMLINVLERIVALLHPIMPFVTEEIWQQIKPKLQRPEPCLSYRKYPNIKVNLDTTDGEHQLEILAAIKKFKGMHNLGKKHKLTFSIAPAFTNTKAIEYLTNSEFSDSKEHKEGVITCTNFKLYYAKSSIASTNQPSVNVKKIQAEIKALEQKLQNPGFINKAPAAVVKKEHEKLQKLKAMLNSQAAQ